MELRTFYISAVPIGTLFHFKMMKWWNSLDTFNATEENIFDKMIYMSDIRI